MHLLRFGGPHPHQKAEQVNGESDEHFPMFASSSTSLSHRDTSKEWSRETFETLDHKENIIIGHSHHSQQETKTSHMLGRQLKWYQVGTGRELDLDRFWTSPLALTCCFFVVAAIYCRDLRLLYGAVGAMLVKTEAILAKWVHYIRENEKIQECIDIDKKYLKIIQLDCQSFLDPKNGEKHRFLDRFRRIRAASVVHHFHMEKEVLSSFIKKRNQSMRLHQMEQATTSRGS